MKRAGCGSSERCAAVVALLLGVALSGAGCGRGDAAGPPAPITQAAILLTGGDAPPPDDAAWRPVALPDDWSRSRPTVGGDAWYRIEFDVRTSPPPLTAIYVPRLSMVARPYVNGTRLTDGGRFDEPVTRLWYRPQLYWVPPAVLDPGRNVFHLRLRAYPDNQAGLSEVHIGDPAVLRARWERHVFRQVTAMQATTGITFALGVLVLVAWFVLRWTSAYGWFGLAAMCWTLHSTLVLTVDIPVPTLVWEVLIVASLIWVVVAMMMFALRFAGLRRPWLEAAALTYAVVSPLVLWAAGLAQIFGVANALLLALLFLGAYEFKILLDVARRSRSAESMLLVGAALFVLGLGAHDWFNRQGAFAFAEPFNMHYGVPVLFIAVFWNLLGQVAAGRRAAETLNVELEARVREKALALERSYAELRAAYAAETLAGERERIMRDMHDGVGSQLIAARQLASQGTLGAGELTALLDECIDDLRLMIDSLEPTDGDLVTVLGNLRYRLTERLARQGVALRWEVADLPATGLLPRDILQVLRIVQEAVANVLKHAGATEVVVSAGLAADGTEILLSVRDNGRGFPTDAPRRGGRGLGNMRQRATAVGGDLRVEGGPSGSIVTLALPVRPASAARDGTRTDVQRPA
ncbi:MAG: ATP-binding protein [Vicinamibacterales bacterium]